MLYGFRLTGWTTVPTRSTLASSLRKPPLHDRRLEAGADLVPFAGREMPIAFAGIRPEQEEPVA